MAHITFVHGIANKPPADRLLEDWRRALAQDDGINLSTKGVTSSMVYWADVLYESPSEDGGGNESAGGEDFTEARDDDDAWRSGLSGEEQEFVDRFTERLGFEAPSPGGDEFQPEISDDPGFERVPLPWFLKRRLMKILLRDVHHYLFNHQHSPRAGVSYRVRDEIRDRFVSALMSDSENNSDGPHIVVSHSMGTVIAYDCLKRVPGCPEVDSLLTLGSPLGLDEIQDMMKPEWSREDGYPGGNIRKGWANVADQLDPVSLDTELANDYRKAGHKVILDKRQSNGGAWRHSLSKYMGKDELRSILAQQLEVNWP